MDQLRLVLSLEKKMNDIIGKIVFNSIINSGFTQIDSKRVLDAIVKDALTTLSVSYEEKDFEGIVSATLKFMNTVEAPIENLDDIDDPDDDDDQDYEDALDEWYENAGEIYDYLEEHQHIMPEDGTCFQNFDFTLNYISDLSDAFPDADVEEEASELRRLLAKLSDLAEEFAIEAKQVDDLLGIIEGKIIVRR
jgi:hypothetical protein